MTAFMDIASLRAFAVVAHELNMRGAADLLNISQPPLSRKIKNLEDRLGVCLFIRRSYGLELTDHGKELLGIIQPLLNMQEDDQKKLDMFKKSETCIIGFTTAFEQSVYEPVISVLKSLCDKDKIIIKRAASVQLATDVIKGNIQAAWVALPINNPNISTINISYSEQLLAVIPDSWQNIDTDIELSELNGKPFFWFSAYRNPDWHEKMSKVFKQLDFRPDYLDEPLEFEVLLARIAAGEGWGLIPESFAAIQRKGIKYLKAHDLPALEMGIIYKDKNGEMIAHNYLNAIN
ncbi:MAG: LysR family transcriptional regulator [Desulfovibrio sp.]|nr:LysR family transcriptional regulator [Desulfovibrio sp.]